MQILPLTSYFPKRADTKKKKNQTPRLSFFNHKTYGIQLHRCDSQTLDINTCGFRISREDLEAVSKSRNFNPMHRIKQETQQQKTDDIQTLS